MQSHPSFQPFLRYVWQHSAFYRNLYLAHGIRERDLAAVTLQDLPIVTKQLFLDNFDDAVTDPRIRAAALEEWLQHDHDPRSRYLGEFLVLHSTGSSGRLSNIVYDETGWQSMSALAAGYLHPAKPPGGIRCRSAFFIGDLGHVASATTAMNLSPQAFDCLTVSLKDPIEETIARLNAFQPHRLTSYSSSLGWLAELSLGGRLKISPRDVVASADRMTPAVESMIRQAWNPNIYDLYAVTEALFLAVKQPGQSEWKVLDEIQTLEVLDAEHRQVQPGQMGRAVLTNYSNRVMPFLRYDLTDYVICGETRPGNSTLRAIVCRTFENLPIRLDDGRTGEIPSYALAHIAAAGPHAFQFVSISPDEAQLEYCAPQNLDARLQAEISALQAQWGGARTRFSVRRVDHLWDDAQALKFKLVRRPGDLLVGLPAHILGPAPAELPPQQLRPGGGFVPFVREHLQGSLAALFERQAARRPDATALTDGDLCLTYAGLNRAANRAAHALRARNLNPLHPVALVFTHKAAMLTAMLAVVKAGGWYAPLDPGHPAARNSAILREIEAELVLTDGESLAAARSYGFADSQIVNLDELDGSLAEINLGLPSSPAAPVCILFTSGSTGQPKGVVLDQRAVLHRAMLYTNDYAIGPDDRLALLQSYVFNASVREIYAALLNGAGLCLYSLKREGVHHLAAWLEGQGISLLYMVPAAFRVFLETLKGEKFPRLRVIRLGGEAVLARDVAGFQRHFGAGCLLANGLASTETGTICQDFIDHRSPILGSRAPVGCAVQDKVVSLLDEGGRPVADGATGEIVVASEFFGPGYFPLAGIGMHPPASVSPGPARVIHTGDLGRRLPDGRIVLLGRKDWQVKLRGQRINLLEIEQALLSLEDVAEAAVTLQAAEDGAGFLAAYIQPKMPGAPDETRLRRALSALLPAVMIPSVFLFIDQLPHTMSGKVDRLALPPARRAPLAGRQPQKTPPQTPAELALAGIWCQLLGIQQVDSGDNFFELGGDSLLASALMARIETRFERKLPLSDLFQYGTLRKLAAAIQQKDDTGQAGYLFTIQPSGDQAPVFFFSGLGGDELSARILAARLGSRHPLFGLRAVEFGGMAGKEKTIEQVAAQYAAAIRTAWPRAPYILLGYSFGGHLALETARLLASPGETQPLLVLIDTYPPTPMRGTTLVRRVRFHINNLRRLQGIKELGGYLRERLLRIYLRLIYRPFTRGIARQIKAPDSSPIAAAQIALAAYQPQPYPGRVVLFQAGQREWFMDSDPMEPWKQVISGELQIHIVPGEHLNLIKEPYVVELARQIREAMD